MNAAMTAGGVRPGRFARLLHAVLTLALGTLACMSALTSVVALGWFQTWMRRHALRTVGAIPGADDEPRWVMGPGGGILNRSLGGLAQNLRSGCIAAVGVFLATLPFTALWLVSWWAGWLNSFNKGYEQSAVGPILGMSGVALCLVTMVYLPMALAHQAVENRLFAIFDLARVRSAVAHAGWGYVALALVTVIAALPVFAGRGLVVFAEGIVPGLADFTPEQMSDLATQIALIKAAYVFVALMVLRRWGAGEYARAVMRASGGRDAAIWSGAVLVKHVRPAPGRARSVAVLRWLRGAMLMVIWFGLVTQIFVGQFLNHDWHVWLTHPFILLPWSA